MTLGTWLRIGIGLTYSPCERPEAKLLSEISQLDSPQGSTKCVIICLRSNLDRDREETGARATMIDLERATQSIAWGKLTLVGRPHQPAAHGMKGAK